MTRRLLSSAVVAVAMVLASCGPQATPAAAPEPAAEQPPPLHRGPLSDYVPAAGLRWLVMGEPKTLATTPGLPAALERLLPARRLDEFASDAGIDLRTVPSAAVAGFDYAELYLAATPDGADARVETQFLERLVDEPKRTQPHPRIHRTMGIIGMTPETLVRVNEQLVAVSVGDPMPARVVELFALQKLEKSPPALAGAALSTLPDAAHRGPARFYAPGPLSPEWLQGGRGLFGLTLALGATLEPNGDQLRATLYLTGDWAAVQDAPTRLLAAWEDLASSGLGRLLAFDDPASEPVLSATDELLKLQVDLRLEPLVDGLHAAVAADVWQMMDLEPPPTPSTPHENIP